MTEHPTKRWRPIAAGWLSLRLAWAIGLGALALSLVIAFVGVNMRLGFLILGYVTMTLSYGLWLKHVPIVDLVCVAAGFVLRMIAGGLDRSGSRIDADESLPDYGYTGMVLLTGRRG